MNRLYYCRGPAAIIRVVKVQIQTMKYLRRIQVSEVEGQVAEELEGVDDEAEADETGVVADVGQDVDLSPRAVAVGV